MPQTLLGLLALALAALLTVNSQQHQMGSFKDRLVEEYRLAGAGVATHVMEMIAARSFDEASTPLAIEDRDGDGSSALPQLSDFTPDADFGEMKEATDIDANANQDILDRIIGNRGLHKGFFKNYSPLTAECDLITHSFACDDVDDLDGMRDELIYVEFSSGDTMPFEVDIDVYYVELSAPETPVYSGPTLNKRVIVRVASPDLPTYGDLVTIERVISYDPIKADRDHEAICGTVDGVENLQDCIDGYINS